MKAFVARARRKLFAAKHVIFYSDDTPDCLYLILEGSVSILVEDDTGREMVLAYRHPGEFIGEMCLFPALNSRSALVMTRTDTWVAEMSFEEFREFAENRGDIMFLLAEQLALRLRETSRRLADLNFLDVTGRIARILLDLASQPDAETTDQGRRISLSRQELAKIAGCSREMAGRVLKELELSQLIESCGRHILILKPAT